MAEGPETLREPVRRLVFLLGGQPIRDDTGSVVVDTDLSVLLGFPRAARELRKFIRNTRGRGSSPRTE